MAFERWFPKINDKTRLGLLQKTLIYKANIDCWVYEVITCDQQICIGPTLYFNRDISISARE